MKIAYVVIFFFNSLTSSFGQQAVIKSMIDSLEYLTTDTLDCSADLYWRIVAKGDKAIPFLIDRLTDTTQTKVKYHCKASFLNVGEVAQFALTQIADFPASLITKIQFDYFIIDESGRSCWSFYDFFFINSNKLRYKKNVMDWYAQQKSKYKEEKISFKNQTECQKKYGITARYKWTE